jgi:L-serine dehydratase
MRVYRHAKGDKAIMVIESDQEIPERAKEVIKNIDGILNAIILNPV